MNMSYDNYNMYIASIPKHDTEDEEEELDGTVNLFNIHD